ncbi:MAG TPA: hypothetical protein EYO45_03720 [Candidatus Marinimicrobia bacterium]|nr:hypothetical protein [Candidatus Neomarinimicrobiota bacterium]
MKIFYFLFCLGCGGTRGWRWLLFFTWG